MQYTTSFPLSENPISEGSKWIVPSAVGSGSLWGDVETSPGLAFGVSEPTQYGDPTSLLTGNWGSNQTVSAVVKITNTVVQSGTCCHEVELRLRSNITGNSNTGYEANCSVMSDNTYCGIVRWNGPNGSWCGIATNYSAYATNGDVLMATISGTNPVVITFYKNGVQIVQASDNGAGSICQNTVQQGAGPGGPFPSGNPGIGFYDQTDSNWSYFGFSQVKMTDDSGSATN